MFLTVQEMQLLCVFHKGTVSETLASLHGVDQIPSDKAALFQSVREKLSCLKAGEALCLAFDPEV